MMMSNSSAPLGTEDALAPENRQAMSDLRRRTVGSQRSLLSIVGEPGTGKSTFAVMLRQPLSTE